jgi:hypothetical protein
MGELTMETLAKRLDRLERENRRRKLAGVLVLVLVAAVVLMGQAMSDFAPPGKPGKIVWATQFILHDARGGVRAELGTLPGGEVRLILYDRGYGEGTSVVLGVGPETSPSLIFRDKDGKIIWSAP